MASRRERIRENLQRNAEEMNASSIPEQKDIMDMHAQTTEQNDTSDPNKPEAPTKPAKKSNAGRKAKKESEKKKQIALTLKPETVVALESSDPDFRRLLSRYIDKNINAITKAIKSL